MKKSIVFFIVFFSFCSLSAQQFTDIGAGLYPVEGWTCDWGDYDNDGDLDIVYSGRDGYMQYVAKLYRNDAGVFTEIVSAIPNNEYLSIKWGDYDNDNDLDLICCFFDSPSILYNNSGGIFTNTVSNLPNSFYSEWADYDNDGDLDLLFANGYGNHSSSIFTNNNGVFNNSGIVLGSSRSISGGDYDRDGDIDLLLAGGATRIYQNNNCNFSAFEIDPDNYPSPVCKWGDYDNDGDLDILLMGENYSSSHQFCTILYKNVDNSFSTKILGFWGLHAGDVDWGDFDNDGLLDFVIHGAKQDITKKTELYKNMGGDIFNMTPDHGLPDVLYSSSAWGDYNNDGDLDLFLCGVSNSGLIAKVFSNNNLVVNTAPNPPSFLSYSQAGKEIILQWNAATDAQTPSLGLTYNLRMGIIPGGVDIISPRAFVGGLYDGYRKIADYGSQFNNTSWTIKNLLTGTYYWSVQAVDNGFLGSAFAAESSLYIDADAPIFTNLVPEDDGIKAIKQSLQISFEENVYAQAGKNITIYYDNRTILEQIPATSSRVNITDNVVTIKQSTFDIGNFYVNIDSSAFTDQFGNGFMGILDNCTWNYSVYTPDQFAGNSLEFDGIDDYIDCGNDTQFDITSTNIAIEAWIYPTDFKTNFWKNTILGKDYWMGVSEAGYVFRFGGVNGTLSFVFGSIVGWQEINAPDILTLNAWQHVAVVYDGSNFSLYLNGESVVTQSQSNSITSSPVNLCIGQSPGDPLNRNMAGKMDEIRLWNIPRSTQQIRENMYLSLIGTEPGLIGNWQFNEGSGNQTLETVYGGNDLMVNMTEDDWIYSTIPFGCGISNSQTETAGTVNFTDTGLSMYFSSQNGAEITVTRIDTIPNIIPIEPDSVFDFQYWVVNRYGDGAFNVDLTFSINEDITTDDETSPEQIVLFTRSSNADTSWAFLQSADSVNSSVDEATFDGITDISQFIVGRWIRSIDPPQNVTVTTISDSIHISWDAVPGAISYKIYSSDHPNSGFTEDTTGTFDNESWSAPVPNRKKFYFVTAIK